MVDKGEEIVKFRSFDDVKKLISEIQGLFGEIRNSDQIRVSGRWSIQDIGLEIDYSTNKFCSGSCNTNCSGCSACSGCSGCDTTSTANIKNVFDEQCPVEEYS